MVTVARPYRWPAESRWLPILVSSFGLLLLGAEVTSVNTRGSWAERPWSAVSFVLTFATVGLCILYPRWALLPWGFVLLLAMTAGEWEFASTANLAVLVVTFAHERLRWSIAVFGLYLFAAALSDLVLPRYGLFWTAAIISTPAVGIGLLARSLEARARRRDTQIAEIERRARATAEEERATLSRDLHDIVSHRLTTIHDTAVGYLPTDPPEQLAEALNRVTTQAADGLYDLGGLLVRLRSAVGPRGAIPGPPLDLAAEVDGLAQALRDSGRTPATRIADATIPRALSLAVMRILQESVTNIMRYSPRGSPCSIDLTTSDNTVIIDVVSPLGSTAPQAPAAHLGIRGIRERAQAWGGTADVGPHDDTWIVHATLPITRERPLPAEGRSAGLPSVQ